MTKTDRRTLLRGSALAIGTAAAGTLGTSSASAGSGARPVDGDRLVLLGTAGGPTMDPSRSGISTAIVVNDRTYIVDCGAGMLHRMAQAGYTRAQVRTDLGGVYLTHLHSDHVADLFNLFMVPWVRSQVAVYGPGRAGTPIPVYPEGREAPEHYNPDNPTPGTRDLIDGQVMSFAYDLNFRRADQANPDLRAAIRPVDIGRPLPGYVPDLVIPSPDAGPENPAPDMEPFLVHPYDENGVQVTATLVPHGPMFPSLAYRFDTPGCSVVVSGDTARSANLVRLAAGADYLVHEVIDAPTVERLLGDDAELAHHIVTAHTDAPDVGRVAAEAEVGTVVLTHIFPIEGDDLPDRHWRRQVATHFDGDIVVGRDLMELPL